MALRVFQLAGLLVVVFATGASQEHDAYAEPECFTEKATHWVTELLTAGALEAVCKSGLCQNGDLQRLTLGEVRDLVSRSESRSPTIAARTNRHGISREERPNTLGGGGNSSSVGGDGYSHIASLVAEDTSQPTKPCRAVFHLPKEEVVVNNHIADAFDRRWKETAPEWHRNYTAWNADLSKWYGEAPVAVEQYNHYGWDAFAFDEGAGDLHIKAFIFSHVRERRSSAYRMAAAAGFQDIEFPSTLPYQEVDLEKLKVHGEVVQDFMEGYTREQQQKFFAHATDYKDVIKQAVEEGRAWVAMLEDDIILTAPPSVAYERIKQAVVQHAKDEPPSR